MSGYEGFKECGNIKILDKDVKVFFSIPKDRCFIFCKIDKNHFSLAVRGEKPTSFDLLILKNSVLEEILKGGG